MRSRNSSPKWSAGGRALITCTLLLCFTLAFKGSAAGQAQVWTRGGHPQRARNTSPIEARVKRFAAVLDLTPAQQAGVKKLLEKQREQSDRLWENPALSPIDRGYKLRALNEETSALVDAQLTAEQRKKYQELRQRANAEPGTNPPAQGQSDAKAK